MDRLSSSARSRSGSGSKIGSRTITLLVLLLALLTCSEPCDAQALEDVKVGHWVELRGDLSPDGVFRASKLKVLAPGNSEVLIGTASDVDVAGRRFTLLGRSFRVLDSTSFREITLKTLSGARIRVEARWRGEDSFSARTIAPMPAGRDEIRGRAEAIKHTEHGLEFQMIGFHALVLSDVGLENDKPFTDLPLAPKVLHDVAGPNFDERVREDYVPSSIQLAEDLTFGALLESGGAEQANFDLDNGSNKDRTRGYLLLKGRLNWTPTDTFRARLVERYEYKLRHAVNGADQNTGSFQLEEAWGQWSDIFGTGVNLRAGRQKFIDEREWIYRAFLDAGRITWIRPGVRFELSASTLYDFEPVDLGSTQRNLHTDNYIAYLSNNDHHRELAVWVVDRRGDQSPREKPFYFGLSAYGEWIPQNKVWLDSSLLRGYTGTVNQRGYAVDVGSTWSPPALGLFSFTVGWAFGSGDRSATNAVDEGFQQTGLQRNKDTWAGLMNFKYYGELFDPELSNLSIGTLGVGARLNSALSLDLVWHGYDQVQAATSQRNTNLKANPDGIHEDLGQEFDVILGSKAIKDWDLELIYGRFVPGSAFPGGDAANLVSILLRTRF